MLRMATFCQLSASYQFYATNRPFLKPGGPAEQMLAQLNELAKQRPLTISEAHQRSWLVDTLAYYQLWYKIYSGKTGMRPWHIKNAIAYFVVCLLLVNLLRLYPHVGWFECNMFLAFSCFCVGLIWLLSFHDFHINGIADTLIGNHVFPWICTFISIFLCFFLMFYPLPLIGISSGFAIFLLFCLGEPSKGTNGFGLDQLDKLPNPQIDKGYEEPAFLSNAKDEKKEIIYYIV